MDKITKKKTNKTDVNKMRLQAIHINSNNKDLNNDDKVDIYKEFQLESFSYDSEGKPVQDNSVELNNAVTPNTTDSLQQVIHQKMQQEIYKKYH